MFRFGFLLAVVLGAASCVAGSPTGATSSLPEPSPVVPTQITAIPSPPQDVTIPGAQGLALRGTWLAASPADSPAVLLLHMYAGRRADWRELAESLQQSGIASLAIDLRGHGDTGGEEDWSLAVEDVAAAHAWMAALPEVDAGRRATVGASIGANLALAHAAQDDGIRAVALLSPGLDYFRVAIEGLMTPYGERPIFLTASEKDAYSADTVHTLAGEASGPVDLLVYSGGAHGTQIFSTQADLLPSLAGFLKEILTQ